MRKSNSKITKQKTFNYAFKRTPNYKKTQCIHRVEYFCMHFKILKNFFSAVLIQSAALHLKNIIMQIKMLFKQEKRKMQPQKTYDLFINIPKDCAPSCFCEYTDYIVCQREAKEFCLIFFMNETFFIMPRKFKLIFFLFEGLK